MLEASVSVHSQPICLLVSTQLLCTRLAVTLSILLINYMLTLRGEGMDSIFRNSWVVRRRKLGPAGAN